MEHLIPTIREIAERIAAKEEKRRTLAHFLRSLPAGGREAVRPSELDGVRIMGVDGGLVKKSLHGLDCMLTRAVAVCFSYQNGKVGHVDYYPSRLPVPEPAIVESVSDLEWMYYSAIKRQRTEVQAAREAMKRFRPDVVLMDGMLLPHPSDRPAKGSPAFPQYQELMAEIRQLYETALDQRIALAGVIEDSRSSRFCSHVAGQILRGRPAAPEAEKLLGETTDTSLLFWMLDKGERTAIFPCVEDRETHPLGKDIGDSVDRLFMFYLKTARMDRPIRVDFLAQDSGQIREEADRLAGILLSVSGQHAGYGLPAPLIEADNRAKLSENEMENFYAQVLSMTGTLPAIMRLRRDQRPF